METSEIHVYLEDEGTEGDALGPASPLAVSAAGLEEEMKTRCVMTIASVISCLLLLFATALAASNNPSKKKLMKLEAGNVTVLADPTYTVSRVEWKSSASGVVLGKMLHGYQLEQGVGAPQAKYVENSPFK